MAMDTISALRQRMIEDMNLRKLGAHTHKSHIYSCKRFAAFLKRSPDTATLEDIRLFQLHLAETGMSIGNRNRIMTGVRFLFRVTLRRLDLAAEIYHLREPLKIPQVVSPDEARRLLAGANSLKARVMLSLCYGCGLRAGEVVRLKVKHIDSAQRIIRIEQSKGRKDRHVMLSPETLDLLRQWWKARRDFDATTPLQERWLFPGRRPGKPTHSPSIPSVFPPPRAPPKNTSKMGHLSNAICAGLPRADQATVQSSTARCPAGPSAPVVNIASPIPLRSIVLESRPRSGA